MTLDLVESPAATGGHYGTFTGDHRISLDDRGRNGRVRERFREGIGCIASRFLETARLLSILILSSAVVVDFQTNDVLSDRDFELTFSEILDAFTMSH